MMFGHSMIWPIVAQPKKMFSFGIPLDPLKEAIKNFGHSNSSYEGQSAKINLKLKCPLGYFSTHGGKFMPLVVSKEI